MPAVEPNKARNTYVRLSGLPKLSRSGFLLVVPALFARANSGDSCIFTRMYSDTASSRNESKNGTRQPQTLNDSGLKAKRVVAITIMLRKKPSVAVV